jgi:Asp-tRNA(Asn)/Glu-tRNA(Gln) amidotransferase A subunit family amidase
MAEIISSSCQATRREGGAASTIARAMSWSKQASCLARVVAKQFLPMLLIALLNGCATPTRHPASATRDNAFIAYWPPNKESRKLRLAVKDLIDMKGVVTTGGSEFLAKKSPPAKRDAKCLAIARQRHVQFVGKTNTTELAVAVSGINEYFGTPRNPISRRKLIPGGSSSGSAVAVATGWADVAFGTDTAGSIRIPAACCGVVGLKTTFGLVPLDGVYPIAPNQLDTVGPLARDIAGAVQGMDLLKSGFADEYRQAAATASGKDIRVGRLYLNGTNAKIDRAVDAALAAAQFEVVKLDDHFREQWSQAQKDAATVAAASAWVYDLPFRNEPGLTVRTKAIIALGEFQYKTAYRDALRRQAQWKAVIGRVLKQVDFIAVPTMQNLPPRLPPFGGTVAFEARVLAMQNTAAVNFAGVPALAIPVPIANKSVPFTSLQLVGPPRSEAALLNAGRLIEATRTTGTPTRGN